ncbi:MAG: hypothetical protein R3B47_15540 [Bacteroidia bacterium]
MLSETCGATARARSLRRVIAVAVLIAIFTRSLNEGTYAVMIDNMVGMYTGYVQVHQKGYWEEQSRWIMPLSLMKP